MSEHQCVIEARNLSVFHHSGALVSKKSYVVRNLSLHIHEGEIVGLAGESGSGKTSLGKALLDLIPTWDGDVYWNGSNIRNIDIRPFRRHYGWMCQEPSLAFNPRKRILHTLTEPMLVHREARTPEEAESILRKYLKDMALDDNLLGRYPFELSGGQIQRFALLRILALMPWFLVLDEPTSSLDPINQREILRLLLSWKEKRGLTILFISHSRALLERVCHRTIILDYQHGKM